MASSMTTTTKLRMPRLREDEVIWGYGIFGQNTLSFGCRTC